MQKLKPIQMRRCNRPNASKPESLICTSLNLRALSGVSSKACPDEPKPESLVWSLVKSQSREASTREPRWRPFIRLRYFTDLFPGPSRQRYVRSRWPTQLHKPTLFLSFIRIRSLGSTYTCFIDPRTKILILFRVCLMRILRVKFLHYFPSKLIKYLMFREDFKE
jgi:hypothetical protein